MVFIAYDYQVFYSQEYGGISRYFCEIAPRIANLSGCDVKIVAGAYMNKYLRDCPQKNLVIGFYLPPIPKTWTIRLVFNSELCNWWFRTRSPEIVHQTYYSLPKIYSKKSKLVVTIYDMIYEKFPNLFQRVNEVCRAKIAAIKQADHIICISENTKQDLLYFFGDINPNKVSVVYLASSLKLNNLPSLFAQNKLLFPYILYVGQRFGYKNFHRLLQTYAISSSLKRDFKIVCFGGGEFSSQELKLMHELGLAKGQVIQMSGDDSMLAYLYRKADAFVYPSLYEGFGIPLLEAMSFDCPVVCSNNSSLPEVVGNAAELFDPYHCESMAFALEGVLYSKERRETLINLGRERIKSFSWENCAKQTHSIYLSLL